jgi:hypothetical protein
VVDFSTSIMRIFASAVPGRTETAKIPVDDRASLTNLSPALSHLSKVDVSVG